MQGYEFGFDFNEMLGMDLAECREKIDVKEFDEEMRTLKFPTDSRILFTSVEDFIRRGTTVPAEIWNKAVMLDATRRAVYGLDPVSVVSSAVYKVGINDFEMDTMKKAISGMVFDFIPIKQNDCNDVFLLINKPAAERVVHNHPADFDAEAKADIVQWINAKIATKLKKPAPWKEELPVLEDGLLSGFPRKSVLEYPKFDALRKKYPEFARVYSAHIFHGANVYEVLEVIDSLGMPERDSAHLKHILALQPKCPDRAAVPKAGFMMLDEADLLYGARRAYWFNKLDQIYKPLMLWQTQNF